jgi:thymidine phosphorylase
MSANDQKQKRGDDDTDDNNEAFDAVSMIRLRRLNLRPYTVPELEWWMKSYVNGNIPDYQMAAWLMAVCCNGLSPENTATLTACMVESGVRIDWPTTVDDGILSKKTNNKPLIDKHSTGGVGDKVSLILAPTAASLGVAVPMMAGRGLGHTGGTIDKLESSIPGFRCDLSVQEFQDTCTAIGCVISAATPELCPADKKLYALRDVTDTVSSLPLQTASIMSKKIAENPQSLVLGKGVLELW